MTIEHSPFPSDETLAAYIDGGLDKETRKRVAEHMADCVDCFDVLLASSEIQNDNVVRPNVWPRYVAVPVAAAAMIAIVLTVPAVRERIWPSDDLRQLAQAAPAHRLNDGRVTGFPFHELKRMRGAKKRDKDDPALDPANYKFVFIADKVRQKAEQHETARLLHARGVAELELGDRDHTAVFTLEKALHEQTKPDPQLLSDLAAAYIAAGDYAKASAAAERAWQLEHTPEIAWNRAVAAEHADPPPVAIAKWNQYLEIDRSSLWRPEAQKRLADFQESLKYAR